MEILYKDKNIVAVYKPAGIPSQPDPSGDADAMTLCSELLEKSGDKNTELYLIHRLDRVVGGILVFARTKACAADLSSIISDRRVKKEYLAVIDGEADGGILTDFLYKDARAGKAFVVDRKRAGVKEASLEYSALSKLKTDNGIKTLVKIELHTGRFHQIRAQFSARKTPLVGDKKYGSKDALAHMPSLFCIGLSFELFGKEISVSAYPDTETYPWGRFYEKIKELSEDE